MTRPVTFRQADLERAIRALKAVGETVTGVEQTPEGGFRVLTVSGAAEQPLSALERWELENGHRAA